MKCRPGKPCPTLAALMTEGPVKIKLEIQLPDQPPDKKFTAIFIETVKISMHDEVTGKRKEMKNAEILTYCPGCGIRFDRLIDNYAPPLVQERTN